MESELRILMLEDVPADAELEIRELKRAGLRVTHKVVETEDAFHGALREFQPQLIISDFSMPHFDGMSALTIARELVPDVPFIFVSGTIGEEYAIRALKNGATDYVLKNNLLRLPTAVERALKDKEASAARRISEARHRATFDNAPIGIMHTDIDADRILLVNPRLSTMLGHTQDALLGMIWDDILHPDHRGTDRGMYRERMLNGELSTFSSDSQFVRKDGSAIWVNCTISLVCDAAGKPHYFIRMVEDITERKSQELKIARLSRIQEVLSGINSAIVRIRNRLELFREACRIAVEHGNFGLAWIGVFDPVTLDVTPVASAGLGSDELKEGRSTARSDVPLGQGLVGQAIRGRKAAFSNDIAAETGVGGRRRQEALRQGYRSLIALPLFTEDAVTGIVALFAKEPGFFDEEELKLLTELAGDISFALEYIGKEEKLNYLAYYDVVTGLPNRTLFNDRLEQRITASRDANQIVSVMMLDIERFRLVNDSFGRPAGDDLLRQVSQRLKDSLEGSDILAHIGGDHFAIATRRLEEVGEIAHILDQILTGISGQPFKIDGSELRIASRAGIAVYPTDGTDADRLLKNAEAALKKAKVSGERYLFYAPKMNARIADQMKLENDLHDALLQEQFVLHYQSKFDLASKGIVGMEALIRWKHPRRGMVSPGEFIPLLEETGMILEVGSWALRRAALEHAAWCAKGLKPPRIAVNVSQVQLRRNDFVNYVTEALGAVDGATDRVDIEITESMLMEDIEGSIGKLKALQNLGLLIALDDFGTGYSSLSYLARLPLNSLKIDRSFVIQMPKGPEQMAIVTAVVSLARALNLKVVAEGVETEEQANLLRLLRCDEVQGYLFGKPMPAEDIERLLPRA